LTISPGEAVRYAWAGWLASWLVAALWSSRAARRPPRRTETAYRLLTVIGAVLLFDLRLSWPWATIQVWRPGTDIAWFLVAIALLGFAVTWWARVVLGRLWSSGVAVKADHDMVTAGPYRLVRHPIYSGILLSILATAAIRGTSAAVLGSAAIGFALFIKARAEERFLRSELGSDRYGSYARRVPMLVPFTALHTVRR
jgi:protein-S-isoprenylcysteine O-methyltransferase Ste14